MKQNMKYFKFKMNAKSMFLIVFIKVYCDDDF